MKNFEELKNCFFENPKIQFLSSPIENAKTKEFKNIVDNGKDIVHCIYEDLSEDNALLWGLVLC